MRYEFFLDHQLSKARRCLKQNSYGPHLDNFPLLRSFALNAPTSNIHSLRITADWLSEWDWLFAILRPFARTVICRRSFRQAAGSVWNSLPLAVKSSNSVGKFQSSLKIHRAPTIRFLSTYGALSNEFNSIQIYLYSTFMTLVPHYLQFKAEWSSCFQWYGIY